LTDERIDVRHLAVIRPIAISRRVGFWRLVRIVRVVQMHPREKWPLLAANPRCRFRSHLVARLLNRIQEPRVVFAQLEPI
jgi:hypothetical protein